MGNRVVIAAFRAAFSNRVEGIGPAAVVRGSMEVEAELLFLLVKRFLG